MVIETTYRTINKETRIKSTLSLSLIVLALLLSSVSSYMPPCSLIGILTKFLGCHV